MAKEPHPELRKPIKRRYEAAKRRKVYAGDAAQRAFRLKRWTFGFIAAGYVSLPTALLVGFGLVSVGVAAAMLVGTVAIVYVASGVVSGGAGAVASKIHAPSGDSTPRRAEYSRAQSLMMRGQYRDAAVAYEVHCVEAPEVPDPYFRIAEIYQKHLDDPAESIEWFRRALADADLTPGEELLCIQTIADLYVHRLRTPRKAIPELVKLTKRFPDTDAAEAAQRELDMMRSLLAEEGEGRASFTTDFFEKLEQGVLMEGTTKSREEMERDRIAGALIAADNNRRLAAEQLGITVEQLEEAMKEFRM